jgi:two-component system, OmpR family, sensor histidine kinase KdpD
MESRPNPDALLERVKEQEARRGKGRLKIFLGATAGVGKTYAMLEAARARRAEGRDVAVGIVETHGREDTARLLSGLEIVPPRDVEHRGVRLAEFDLDAALARRPALLLLDELAHTNAPGSRHAKRYQDARELLDAGIDVYTTLNVQHLESLNDIVAQITGVSVQETIPDGSFDDAEEVELVDLPPEDLLRRLAEGKVYVAEQAGRAVRGFFREGNLIALRELALRRTAERVDAQMRTYRRDHGIAATWPAAERLLVCIGPNPASARLIRATRRMAAGLRADWTTLYVETPAHPRLSESDRDALAVNLRLAEDLGGRTVILPGHTVADEILAWAREHNVTKIVAGKPTHPRWRDRLKGSLVDALVRGSGDIDVYVISGDAPADERPLGAGAARHSRPSAYAWAAANVALSTVICAAMSGFFDLSNLVMVYLLGVAFVATRLGRGPAALASVLSVAAFDFGFVPPYFTFAVSDKQYSVTFGVMLIVALLISDLATRVREQGEMARQREHRTAVLYAASRDLAATPAGEEIARLAARHVSDALLSNAAIVLPRADGQLVALAPREATFGLPPRDEAVARWVLEHGRKAGFGTDTLPGADALFLPLVGTRGPLGVVGVRSTGEAFTTEQLHILEALASQTAAALERAELAETAQKAEVDVERERLRNALLSSVSHDLRTPLATITGAASSLLDEPRMSEATQRELTTAIFEEADRLNRLVGNLLDMTRLESGAIRVRRDWQSIEEIVGAGVPRPAKRSGGRHVEKRLAPGVPLVSIDGILIEQVLVNLLENAAKHTPADAVIEVAARVDGAEVTIAVADRGPGLPEGTEARVFEKFYRTESGARGVGLGLTICRGIVAAHGGRIWAENRAGGGAVFRFALPIEGTPPSVPGEEGQAGR